MLLPEIIAVSAVSAAGVVVRMKVMSLEIPTSETIYVLLEDDTIHQGTRYATEGSYGFRFADDVIFDARIDTDHLIVNGVPGRRVIYASYCYPVDIHAARRWKAGSRDVSYVSVSAFVSEDCTLSQSFVGPFCRVRKSKLTRSSVSDFSDVSETTLTKSKVTRSHIVASHLTMSAVKESTVSNSTLTDVGAMTCLFDRSTVTEVKFARWTSVSDSNLSGVHLNKVTLTRVDAKNSNFQWSDVSVSTVNETTVRDGQIEGSTILHSTVDSSGIARSKIVKSSVSESDVVSSDLATTSTMWAQVYACTAEKSDVTGEMHELKLNKVTGHLAYEEDQNNAELTGASLLFSVTNIGSRCAKLNVAITHKDIRLSTGCQAFITMDTFRERLADTHSGDDVPTEEYNAALAFIEQRAAIWRKSQL